MLISHIGAETPSIDAAKTVAKYLDLALTLYDFGLRTHVGNPSPAFIFNLLEVTHSMNDLRITLKQTIDKKKNSHRGRSLGSFDVVRRCLSNRQKSFYEILLVSVMLLGVRDRAKTTQHRNVRIIENQLLRCRKPGFFLHKYLSVSDVTGAVFGSTKPPVCLTLT